MGVGRHVPPPPSTELSKRRITIETIAELRDYVQTVVANIGAEFTEPDDDWMSVACLQHPEGVAVFALDGTLFGNAITKDGLAFALKGAMKALGAIRYAVLFNTHAKRDPSDKEIDAVRREERRIADMEGAHELLLLVYGDAEEERTVVAEIERDGVNPPQLGEWKEVEGIGGRFSGLNEAMQRI